MVNPRIVVSKVAYVRLVGLKSHKRDSLGDVVDSLLDSFDEVSSVDEVSDYVKPVLDDGIVDDFGNKVVFGKPSSKTDYVDVAGVGK